MKMIIHAKIIVKDEILEGYTLYFDEKIIKICEEDKKTSSENTKASEIIDAKGAYLSAGFIDLHIHGSAGVDVMDANPQALEILCSILPSTGTTSFLATTMTMHPEALNKALVNIKHFGKSTQGANILGIHLEGPFLNSSKHGAQDKAYIQEANWTLIAPYMDEIKMITLAPEVGQNKAFIQELKQEYPHIILSIGHSEASYEESKESFALGISHVTHLFNAMPPYHHRNPSIIGAVFEDPKVSCDIIADLIHTHPSTLKLTQSMKQKQMILISDAMRAGCMKCGEYDLGGQKVKVKEGKATLADGTLAGSVLKLNEAVYNILKHTNATLAQAIYTVTQAPAQKLGINKGSLTQGFDADIVLFDKNLNILQSFVGGKEMYAKGESS